MLTLEQLKKYYPGNVIARTTKNVLVEYLQYELLDSLFKQKDSQSLCFIGGTAIRLVYGSSRFSEDLDFDNFGLSFSDFERIVNAACNDLTLKGFSTELRFIEKGAYHCYIRFPEILYRNSLSNLLNEKILIRIDTVEKDLAYKPVLFILNKFDIYREILAAPPEIILSQKLITILERRREKGRDLFDASFLAGITKPDYGYIKQSLGNTEKEFKGRLFNRLDELNFNSLAKDVEPFLVNPDQTERVKSFKRFITTYLQ